MPKRLKVVNPAGERTRPSPIVNMRFRRWANEHVSWEQVLIACGYTIIDRRMLRGARGRIAARGSAVYSDDYYVHCIYHVEQTASLHLSPFGFHCFGCGASGYKVQFVIDALRPRTNKAVKQFFAAATQACKE